MTTTMAKMMSMATLLVAVLIAAQLAFVQCQEIMACKESTEGKRAECASSFRGCFVNASSSLFNTLVAAPDKEGQCGNCLNGYIEISGVCYNISRLPETRPETVNGIVQSFLPAGYYSADEAYLEETRAERTQRLETAMRVISYWNSRLPPPAFRLGITPQTVMTAAERRGRLGVLSNLSDSEAFLSDNHSPLQTFSLFADDDDQQDEHADQDEDADQEEQREKVDIAQFIDWVARRKVTPVRDQGLCAASHAAAVASAIGSALLITSGAHVDLQVDFANAAAVISKARSGANYRNASLQQFLSCDSANLGCAGGNILRAMAYAWENNDFQNNNLGGILSSADYPFSDYFGTTTKLCESSTKQPAFYLNSPRIVTSMHFSSTHASHSFEQRRELLMAAVTKQPVVTTLRANCDLFLSYQSGILTHDEGCQCCSSSCIDHAVLIVGYVSTSSSSPSTPPHWIIQNSWGNTWGEKGLARIAMNNPGCGQYGLFGMLSESITPMDVYNNVNDLPPRNKSKKWWNQSQGWEKAMVIVGSILGFCCLGAIILFIVRR